MILTDRGYAVILTPSGLQTYGGASGHFTELRHFEDGNIAQQIIQQSLVKLRTLISQQHQIEAEIGEINLKAAYNAYSLGAPLTLEDVIEQIQQEVSTLNEAIDEHNSAEKIFDKLIRDRQKIAAKVAKKIAELQLSGNISDITSFIAELKSTIKTLEQEQYNMQTLDNLLNQLSQKEYAQQENILELENNLNSLCRQYLSNGSYNIHLLPITRDKQTQYKVKVSSIPLNDNTPISKEQSVAANALSRYLNKLLQLTQGDAKLVQKQKYTSTKTATSDLVKKMQQAIDALNTAQETLQKSSIEINQKAGRPLVTSALNQLAESLSKGQPANFVITNGLSSQGTSGKIGTFIETVHAVPPNLLELLTTKDAQISLIHTGKYKREVQVPGKVTHKIILDNHSIEIDPNTNAQAIPYTSFTTKPEDDKTDNVIKIAKNNGANYYIAFSDKFRNEEAIRNLALVGSSTVRDKQVKLSPSNLASSKDLFPTNNNALAEDLVFTLLNMSSASILSNGENTAYLHETINAMVLANFLEFSFNLDNLINNIQSIAGDMNKANTLCVFNIADSFFLKSSEVLERVYKQLSDLCSFHDIITTSIKYDTIHRAEPLLKEAYNSKDRSNQEQSAWYWVANQIAANTELLIKMNVQSLLKIF